MRISKSVYWNEDLQKVRWCRHSSHNGDVNYSYVGEMSEPEFDLLIEVLFEIFQDNNIPLEHFIVFFSRIRKFCDEIKEAFPEDPAL